MDIHASKEYHSRTHSLLQKHEHLWFRQRRHINDATNCIHQITGATACKSVCYRVCTKSRNIEEFEISRQLKDGFIEQSNAQWTTPVLFAPKRDGRLRICVYYCNLNTMNVKDSYPLPLIDESINSWGEESILSTIHESNRYCQIKIAEKIATRLLSSAISKRLSTYPCSSDSQTPPLPYNELWISSSPDESGKMPSIHGWHQNLFKRCRRTHSPRGWYHNHNRRGRRYTQPQNDLIL